MDLVTFTEEILNGKLHFLCSIWLRLSNPLPPGVHWRSYTLKRTCCWELQVCLSMNYLLLDARGSRVNETSGQTPFQRTWPWIGSRCLRMDQVTFVEGCLPQILLCPFLNTLTQLLHCLCCTVWNNLKRPIQSASNFTRKTMFNPTWNTQKHLIKIVPQITLCST